MNFTKGGDDISESSKELEENELKTLDWEAEIQGQVNHWCLCAEEEGIRSPLTTSRTRNQVEPARMATAAQARAPAIPRFSGWCCR